MAIAFDATATGSGTNSSPFTFSHTCTGSDLILIVGVNTGDANKIAGTTSVTYNGVSMTELVSAQASNAIKASLFYLVGPSTGSNTVSVSFNTPSSGVMRARSASFTGVTATPTVNDAQAGLSGTSLSLTLTNSTTGAVGVMISGIAGASGFTASGSETQIGTTSSDSGLDTAMWYLGGNSNISMGVTFPDATRAGAALLLTPPAVGPANMKTWDGLATASVKTMDGLAIASVKTWNGLA